MCGYSPLQIINLG
uniref:Uncharacterized protein n=1 Tax=Rhizophora mucronata TaxID=61149 RepID=A0A2P2QVC9_RHIMU